MILVTGGTGLLGSNLLFDLSASGGAIRAIYRDPAKIGTVQKLFRKLDPELGETRFHKIEWMPCDVLDVVTLEEAMTGCDYVYHCAAQVSFRRRDFNQMMKINRQGTFNVVNVALNLPVKKLCYVSSTAAVGKVRVNGHDYVVETNKWTQSPQTSGYALSKYSAEKEVWRAKEEGLNVVIINPSVIFGPGDWEESSLTIFRTLVNGLRFYTKGSNAFVDVRDVVRAMITLQNSDISGERFLCTGTNIRFYELFQLMSKELKVKAPSIFANRFLSGVAWRLLAITELFGKKPTLTRESVSSSHSHTEYDSSRLVKALDFKFTELSDTIAYTVKNRL
ncbi:MAG: NAD-dependent epimerase/dehydratase [Crocinitomicaceae bacterium]|jgi:nucleoside-diphosphate-sugar epimerase|nr:NAD-dependent epimerase/dehydratase [Crocinitomicaceae bacterium]